MYVYTTDVYVKVRLEATGVGIAARCLHMQVSDRPLPSLWSSKYEYVPKHDISSRPSILRVDFCLPDETTCHREAHSFSNDLPIHLKHVRVCR